MAKDPQNQPHQQPQQQQQIPPQQLPQHYVVEANFGPQAAEQVQQQVRPNGAQPQSQFQAPSQVVTDPNQILRIQGEGRKVVIDMSNDAGMREFYARCAYNAGMHNQVASLRHQQLDASLSAGFKRTMDHNIRVKDVATLIVGGLVLWFIYEGIAFKFDLPRVGLFDPSNPLKSLKKAA